MQMNNSIALGFHGLSFFVEAVELLPAYPTSLRLVIHVIKLFLLRHSHSA
jgi:hypothetical protein